MLSIVTTIGCMQPNFMIEGVSPASSVLQNAVSEIFSPMQDKSICIFDNILTGGDKTQVWVCHLSTTQLHNLQKKFIPVILYKMGFACTYLHSTVFGPSSHGGIRSIDLTLEEEIIIIYKVMRTPGQGSGTRFPLNISSKVPIRNRTVVTTTGIPLPTSSSPRKPLLCLPTKVPCQK